MGAGTDSAELRFVELEFVVLESIDLGSDSVAATEHVQLIEVVAELARADAAAGLAAALELAVETAESPEVGTDVRSPVHPGAGPVDPAGLPRPMKARTESAETTRIEFELQQPIDLGTALPELLRPEL